MCGCILGWWRVVYHLRVTVSFNLTFVLVFLIILSGTFLVIFEVGIPNLDFDNYPTTIFRSILTQIYVFLVLFTIFHFDLEKVIIKFGSEFLSKVHPACHNIANDIKPGSDSKKTDKYAVDCSKAECWGVK